MNGKPDCVRAVTFPFKMMKQISLFAKDPRHNQPLPSTHGYFHKRDPETSKIAAEQALRTLPMQCLMVYEAFRKHGPATAKELSRRSGLDYHLISRRISDLKPNFIYETHVRRENSLEYAVRSKHDCR